MERYRFTINDLDGASTYNMRHSPDGWREFGVNFGRETGISNVVKSYTSDWTFIKEDALHIWNKLMAYGPNRRLRLDIEELTDALSGTYTVVYSGFVDLTQAERSGNTLKAPVQEAGFFKALENKWGEDFETPYDRFVSITGNVFREDAKFTSPDSIEAHFPGYRTSCCFLTGGQLVNSETLSDTFFRTTNIQMVDVISNAFGHSTDTGERTQVSLNNAFLIAKDVGSVQGIRISLDYVMYANISEFDIPRGRHDEQFNTWVWLVSVPIPLLESGAVIDFTGNTPGVSVEYLDHTAGRIVYESSSSRNKGYIECSGSFSRTFSNWSTGDPRGCGFFLLIEANFGNPYGPASTAWNGFSADIDSSVGARFNYFNMEAGFDMVVNCGKLVSAASAPDVFRSLVSSINDGRYNVSIDTSAFEAVAGDDMLTSESGMRKKLRVEGPSRHQIVSGSITTSLSSFLAYAAAVYNFRLGVDRDTGHDTYRVYLAHYDNMMSQTSIGTLKSVNGLIARPWRDVLYSSVNCGYNADPEAINSHREINGLFSWATPNTEIEESTLEIVSPYSASTRTFETELYKVHETIGGSENNTVYILSTTRHGTDAHTGAAVFSLKRDIQVEGGCEFPDQEWNVALSPKRMMESHRRELNGYLAFEEGKDVVLTTCDCNAEMVAGGIQENAPFRITGERMFKPIVVEVDAPGGSEWIGMVSANRLGTIRLVQEDRVLCGYIAYGEGSVNINPMENKTSRFTLLLAEISDIPI